MKYRESIRAKHQKRSDFTGIPNENPKTFTEMCFRELWDEKFGSKEKRPKHKFLTNMLDESRIG